MVHATTTAAGHFSVWQSRAGSLPAALADALAVCAHNGVNERECHTEKCPAAVVVA